MLKAQNFIVEGKCFVSAEISSRNIIALKDTLTEFMQTRSFAPENRQATVFQDRFLTTTFVLTSSPRSIPLALKARKGLHLITEDGFVSELSFHCLQKTRVDLPCRVNVSIVPSQVKDKKGFLITVRSEPIVLLQMSILGKKPVLDELIYSYTIENGKEFVNNVMLGIGATVLERPKALSEYSGNLAIERMERFGFDQIALLLRQGRTKIEAGNTEDGLTDLREALQDFVSECIKRVGGKSQNTIRKDLDSLKDLGFIDDWMHETVNNFLYEWMYRYLSAKPVHRRERVGYNDSRLLFSISEEIMSYLIDKVTLR